MSFISPMFWPSNLLGFCSGKLIMFYKGLNPCSNIYGVDKLIRGVPRIWEGGGQEFFFSDLGICMSLRDMLRMAKPCALLGGFGGMLPRENFLKRCNLVRFRVYFDQILSLFFSKKCHFLYKKTNILDTHLLWGISREEIFENLLRLMRFGVYFETKMTIFIKK